MCQPGNIHFYTCDQQHLQTKLTLTIWLLSAANTANLPKHFYLSYSYLRERANIFTHVCLSVILTVSRTTQQLWITFITFWKVLAQCRINHCAGCTMGEPPPVRIPWPTANFLPLRFDVCTVTKMFTNHAFRVGLHITFGSNDRGIPIQ